MISILFWVTGWSKNLSTCAMKAEYVPIVCLFVIIPVCGYIGWRHAFWYLQRRVHQSDLGEHTQQSGQGVLAVSPSHQVTTSQEENATAIAGANEQA